MKLLFCLRCHDLIRLHPQAGRARECDCKKSSGYYKDEIHAVYKGPCIPLGIDNNSLAQVTRRDNSEYVPYADLNIRAFRFRKDAGHVRFIGKEPDPFADELQRYLAIFEGHKKIR